MDDRLPFYRNPKRQIILVLIVAFLLYIFLMGNQGQATGIAVGQEFAYLTVGELGGLRVLDIRDPAGLNEISFYDTPSTALGVTQSGNMVYIADGRGGLRIVEVSNPAMPVELGALDTGGTVRAVDVRGSYAYLVEGANGLRVVDVSNPTHPFSVGRVNTPGDARSVETASFYLSLPGFPEPQPQEGAGATHVLVADGGQGLQVIDVQVPTDPVRISNVDVDGEVWDVDLVGRTAYVAAGRGGLAVVDLSDPYSPNIINQIGVNVPIQGVSVLGNYVYLAAGEQGVYVVDATNPANLMVITDYETAGIATGVESFGKYLFVLMGERGVQVIDLVDPLSTGHGRIYETPGEISFAQLVRAILAIPQGRWAEIQAKTWRTLFVVFLDFVLFGILLLFWLGFFSQFALPVRNLEQRRRAFQSLLGYVAGQRGSAVFIQNGQITQRKGEEQRRGPGVAILDTASGAVLRTDHAFTRPIGPGLVFTDAKEYPQDAVDLHRQSNTLGPNEKDDIFSEQKENESDDAYELRKERRYSTSGLTRDGVEVVPNITVSVRLDSKPGEGGTQFGYNPESVWKAITHEGVILDVPSDSEKAELQWDWLPVRLAADLWREYLRKFTLNELFAFDETNSPPISAERETAFDLISRMVKERLTTEKVKELDEFGVETNQEAVSRECAALKKRGIVVEGVRIYNLRFPQEVEKKLVEQWKATWFQRAQREYAEVERLQANERLRARHMALKEFTSVCSQTLSNKLKKGISPPLDDGLEDLLQGTLMLLARDPELQQRLTNQITSLGDAIEWVRNTKDGQL